MNRVKFFIYSAGAILLTSSLLHFIVAAGSAQALTLPEPMLNIPLRYAALLAGAVELAVALICLCGKQVNLQLGWLAWLATNFIIYRAGLLAVHVHPQMTCIGSLTDPLQLSRGTLGIISRLMPFYLFLGSYAGVIWLWLAAKRTPAVKFLKMSCPSCGTHIRFDDRNLGQKIPCPHCKTAITLSKPENLKMSCFFCEGHIEFPRHATDEKLKCPHCRMDITLKDPATI